MTRQYKVSLFAFLFALLFLLPQVAHGRLAVHHIHRRLPPHNQHIHRQNIPTSGLGIVLNISPDPGGTSSPSSTSTAPDGSPATTAPPTTAPPATTTPSSSGSLNAASPFSVLSPSPSSSAPSQTSDPPPSSPPASSPSSPPSTSNPPSSPSTSDYTPTPSPANSTPQSSQPPSPPPTSSPPTATCPVGVDLHGQCIVSSASTDVQPTSTPSSQPQTPTSLTSSSGTPAPPLSSNNPISLPPVSSNAPTSSAPPSSNTPASSPPPSSDTPTSPLSSNIPVSLPPSSSDTPTSSSVPPGSLNTPVSSPLPSQSNAPISLSLSSSTSISLPPLSSNTPNTLPPSSASSPPASSTNSPSPSATPQTTPTALASSPSPNQSSSPSPAHSSSAPIDPCGPSGCTTSGIPTGASTPSSGSVLPQSLTSFPASQLPSSSPGSDSHSQSPPVSTPGSSNSGASSSSVPLQSTPISSQGGTSSIPGSLSQSASGTAAEPSTTSSGTNSASLDASSSPPVISFPSYTTGPSDTTSDHSTSTGSSAPVFTQNSQFSFITVASLLGTSFQSSSIPPTLTNPDAPVTTLSLSDPSTSAAGPVPSAPLPTDLPSRIYPADVVNPSALPSGDVLCSLLFTDYLPWSFVATHTQSQGQLFSWTPVIISQALNISSTDTPPFALQVFVPDSYQGPNDADMLRTEFLFYLPNNLVSVLANEIKVQSSPFYNIEEPYRDLALQVDPAYALTSVPNPSAVPGTTSAASSGGDKSRTATIIGVVSALGGLALIILGTLVFNGVKRSRQLRHQRLSDPNLPNDPYPDRNGRDFDQDSVGGPRRRSFYFAEDSLRGQPQTAEESTVPMAQAQTQYVVQPGSQIQYSSRSSPENMRERRAPVVPGAISAPILTQSSLNW